MLNSFYTEFHPYVEKLIEADINILDESARVLGTHPDFKYQIIATMTKYGPVVKMQLSKMKCKMVGIEKPLTLEGITLADALKLLEYPRKLGVHNNADLLLHKGRNGLYLENGDAKCSIDNINISFDEAVKSIDEAIAKNQEKKNNIIMFL